MVSSTRQTKGGLMTDSLWLTVIRLVTMLISIIITKVLSEELSLVEYGTYSQANLIISTATSLSILGLTDGATYFFNHSTEKKIKAKYMNTVFGIQFIAGLICGILILCGQNLWTSYFNNPALSPLYVWVMFSPMLVNLLNMYQVIFISIGKAKIIAIRNLLFSVSKLFIILVSSYLYDSLTVLFALFFFIDVLQILFFAAYWKQKEFLINPFNMDWDIIKEVLRYCIPLAVFILTSSLTRDMDKMVITRYASTEEYAIFTNCAKVLPFDILSFSMATVMIPTVTRYVANKQYEDAKSLYHNYLQFALMTTWIIAFGAIVCSYDLVQLLYGDKYIAGVDIFRVYILVDMIRFANVAVILRAKGKTVTLMLCSFVTLFANLIFNILFINWFGLIGPAIATLLVTLLMNLFLLKEGAKIIKCKLLELFAGRNILVLLLELLLSAAFASAIGHLFTKRLAWVQAEYRFFAVYVMYLIPLLLLNYRKIINLMKNINRC